MACEFTPCWSSWAGAAPLSCGLAVGLWLRLVGPCDVPRQQLVDAVDGMVGNAGEDFTQVGLRIEPVELGRLRRAPNYAEWACLLR